MLYNVSGNWFFFFFFIFFLVYYNLVFISLLLLLFAANELDLSETFTISIQCHNYMRYSCHIFLRVFIFKGAGQIKRKGFGHRLHLFCHILKIYLPYLIPFTSVTSLIFFKSADENKRKRKRKGSLTFLINLIAMTIQPLPRQTANLLSSSQVITDPCSVIKELLENALDAGARAISIECAPNWLDLIQVRDDGCGVGGGSDEGKLVEVEEDRRVLVRRGWTSKFRFNDDDVNDGLGVGPEGDGDGDDFVATLGFRGEALASIAELSGRLCVTTRVEGEDVGMAMIYGKDGEMVR